MSAYLPKDRSTQQRWICIYPAYIDKNKTIPQGRRICKEKACENPSVEEIKNVCVSQGLDVAIEQKHYPRGFYLDSPSRGRVRVRLYDSDQALANADFASRKQLLQFLGQMIPKLKSRQVKGAEGGGSADAVSSGASATSKKKKNKKGKR